ncbi:MAG: septum formation inhibitor Maf [Melioribacteraceae bacterium]|nr:septum formation inhibitor Maf [Melioribacteraceae bacterium]
MIKQKTPIYLASKSPRRKKLLKQIGINFKSLNVDLDEEIFDGEHPIKTVKRLAEEKLNIAVEKIDEGIVITADTIVVLNKQIIGKPKNKKDAFKILTMLSGKTHYVYTGFAIKNISTKKTIVDYEKTAVTFRELNREEIENYIKSKSPMDKAGAYGIQDYGAVFVEKINGCYYNVMGLPLAKVYNSIMKLM